jgi:hypothetical protein
MENMNSIGIYLSTIITHPDTQKLEYWYCQELYEMSAFLIYNTDENNYPTQQTIL